MVAFQRHTFVVCIILSLLAAPSLATTITRGTTAFNVTATLILEDETSTGIIYTSQCLAECHLPLKILYDGASAPSTRLLNGSDRAAVDWVFRSISNDDIQIADVRVLRDINVTRTITQYAEVNRTYTKRANDTVPTGCGEITQTSYSCVRPEPNGSIEVTASERVWSSAIDDPVTLTKSMPYYIDFVGRRTPRVGSAAADVVPSVLNFSFPEFGWWNATWAACRTITASSSQPAGFIHRVELLTTNMSYSKALANGSDLRIIPGNCSSPNTGAGEENFTISYWNTTANSSLLLINSSVANNRYFALYYNNSAAPRFWNITRTMHYKKRIDFNNETVGTSPTGWVNPSQGNITSSDARFDDKYVNVTDGQGAGGIKSSLIETDNASYPSRWEFDVMHSSLNSNDFWAQVEGFGHQFVFGIASNGSSFCDGHFIRQYGQVLSSNVVYHISINATAPNNGSFAINGVPMTNCREIDSRDSELTETIRINGATTAFEYVDSIAHFGSKNFSDLSYNVGSEEVPSGCTGTLTATLLNPTGNIEIQQNQTFTLSVNVSCTNGCCGAVTGTADPQSANLVGQAPTPLLNYSLLTVVFGSVAAILIIGVKAMI